MGDKGSVLGSRSLTVPGMSELRDVLLVEGLKSILISISQLCDQDLFVKFTKDKCIVLPSNLDCVAFRDRAKGSVLESRSLNVLGMLKLRYVLLGEGLKSNLISISQL